MSDECGISFDNECDDAPEFYTESWRRARKPHRCYECRETIAPGSRYLRVVTKDMGTLSTTHLCEPCNVILCEFVTGNFEFGSLWNNFRTEWEAGVSLQPCLNRLTSVAAKTKLRDMWLAAKALDEIARYQPTRVQEPTA